MIISYVNFIFRIDVLICRSCIYVSLKFVFDLINILVDMKEA